MSLDDLERPKGDLTIIKMDELFHVVFRPAKHPEWFRIVGTFYSYARALCYWDVERTSWPDSFVDEEEGAAAFPVPDLEPPGEREAEHLADMAVLRGEVAATPEKLDQTPHYDENIKDYRQRLHDASLKQGDENRKGYAAKICSEADRAQAKPVKPVALKLAEDEPGEPLTDKQSSVLATLDLAANPEGKVAMSLAEMSAKARVPHGSISFLLESLQRKGLLKVLEPGRNGNSTIYQISRDQIHAQDAA